MFYQRLAGELGRTHPVKVVRAEICWHASTLAEATESAVDALVNESPNGPFALLGTCLGSHFAFDVARRLAELGHAVTLFVIDATEPKEAPAVDAVEKPESRLRHYARLGYMLVAKNMGEDWRMRRHQLQRARSDKNLAWYLELERRQAYLLTQKRVAPVAIEIVLIQSAEFERKWKPRSGWAQLALGGCRYHVLESTTHRELNAAESRLWPRVADLITGNVTIHRQERQE